MSVIARYAYAVRRHGFRSPQVALRRLANRHARPIVPTDDLLSDAFTGLWRGDSERFASLTASYLSLSGAKLNVDDSWSQMLDVVQQRATMEFDHNEAAHRVQLLLDSSSLANERTSVLLAASKLVCSVGLFQQGLVLHDLALKRLRSESEHHNSRRSRYLGAVAALHQGDLDLFAALISAQEKELLRRKSCDPSASLIAYAHLLGITTGTAEHAQLADDSPNSAWHDYVNNSNILLYGPSGSDGLESLDLASFKVLRSLAREVLRWPVSGDCVSGRCDVAYINWETGLWFQSLTTEEQEEAVREWDFLIAKAGPLSLPGLSPHACTLRGADTLPDLFLSGNANMFPIMLLDVLSSAPKRCVVAGVNFFLAQSPYRPDHRGLAGNGRRKDALGASGDPFHMCLSLAHHNAFENRNLVRSLYQLSSIEGDTGFESLMAMTNEAYAEGLAGLYGQKGS